MLKDAMLRRAGRRPVAIALALAGAVAAAAPATAQAATLTGALTNTVTATVSAVAVPVGTTAGTVTELPNGTSCAQVGQESTAFSPWGDNNEYRLVPGGSFSTGSSSWTLSNGAQITATTQTAALSGAPGNGELVLAAGASAVSPFSCVDGAQPTVRFMQTGDPNATLGVSMVFEQSGGQTLTVPVGAIAPGQTWAPSPILYDDQSVAGLLSGGAVAMAVQFTATNGTVAVNDAFVDPRMQY